MEYVKFTIGMVGVAAVTAWASFVDWYVNPIMVRRMERRKTKPQERFSGLEEQAYVVKDSVQGYNASGLEVKTLHGEE